ncbi:hypothetical protein HK099_000294 [Clydaea vesicula]|uniref:Uncharacterized protein n=1 Tax=Clydaea vesicula TaxID=447962 RepID=A0AAD5U5Y2_9FUNG|nr:hypothetical protein HK099_000294 [Clydaea vesicula]
MAEWILADNFNKDNVGLDDKPIPGTKRHNILYLYPNEEYKQLYITVPKAEESFVKIGKPQQREVTKKDGTKFTPPRKSSTIFLDKNNISHMNVYNVIKDITEVVNSNTKLSSTFAYAEHPDNICIFCTLIEDRKNKVYTSFYDQEKVIDVEKLQTFIGRPSLSFSVNMETGKIYVQITAAYVHREIRRIFRGHSQEISPGNISRGES